MGSALDDFSNECSSSAYVFGWNGSAWSQTAKLVASDGAAYHFFGAIVAVSDQTLVVGAYGDDNNSASA